MSKQVAILCAARNSIYKQFPECDVFDIDRDARTFAGGMPAVAHPPCRLWSAYCRHQAKSENREAEKALGLWCAKMVKECGGVLEQPAHSTLWQAAQLPPPGWTVQPRSQGFSMEVSQFWFGDRREKATWLWFFGMLPCDLPDMPFRLKAKGGDRRIWQLMSSRNERERTPKEFAEWLINCAKRVNL